MNLGRRTRITRTLGTSLVSRFDGRKSSRVSMAANTEDECKRVVFERGYSKVLAWTDKPNTHYEPHSHKGRSAIMVVKGNLKIQFPNEKEAPSVHLEPGDVVEIEPGQSHEVWIGENGCTTINGDG